MKTPVFSIIVPVYKPKKEYFDLCVKSLTGQTFSDIEIILVDDGSPDDGGVLCDRYAEKDERISVIHQMNQGVSVARNNGIKQATAEWIMFVDADDWLEVDACARINAHVENTTYDVLMFCVFSEYENKQTILEQLLRPGHLYCRDNIAEREMLYRCAMQPPMVSKKPVSINTFSHSWDKVYRREFIASYQLCFPAGIPSSEDKVFVLRCFEKLNTFCYVDDVLYHYRINNQGVTRRYSDTIDQDRTNLLEILEKIAIRMGAEMDAEGRDGKVIQNDYRLFIFAAITSVLMRKYYHKQWPYGRKNRRKAAIGFLNQTLYDVPLRGLRNSSISPKNVLKKWLICRRMLTTYSLLTTLNEWITNNRASG